jgi:DNA-directed RNA polymerase beta subunit
MQTDNNFEIVTQDSSSKSENKTQSSHVSSDNKFVQSINNNTKSSYGEIKHIAGDWGVEPDELLLVYDALYDAKGHVSHHIESYNKFLDTGIDQIIMDQFSVRRTIKNERTKTEEDKTIKKIEVLVTYTKVKINKPTIADRQSSNVRDLYPMMAVRNNLTYAGKITIDVHIKATAYLHDGTTKIREDDVKGLNIGKIPIMVGGKYCNRYGKSREILMKMKEDPTDDGGYFIIKGVEWAINIIENNLFNKPRIFIHKKEHKGETHRAEFISKPGDSYENQAWLIIRLMNTGGITCQLRKDNLQDVFVPFYMMFRLLGATSDKEIFRYIVYDYDTEIGKQIFKDVKAAMLATYKVNGKNVIAIPEILRRIADAVAHGNNDKFNFLSLDKNPENYQQANNILQREVDKNLFPHIGMEKKNQTGGEKSFRREKMRFLGFLIRRMFLVKYGMLNPTDRDSYVDKRVHTAGPSYAKPVKMYFNSTVNQKVGRKYRDEFKNHQFSNVNLKMTVSHAIFGEFEKSLNQSITIGTKSQISIGRGQHRTNRLSTQQLDRKNQLATKATLRGITTTSATEARQTERAIEMRQVHNTSLGFICVTHSPEGENVGINKQLAIGTIVSSSASSYVMKEMLYEDKDMFKLKDLEPEEIVKNELSGVFVNGHLIGYVEDSIAFIEKYRKMRRQYDPTTNTMVLGKYTTIYWDNTQDEIFFWVDNGRLLRPLFIVYNNRENPELFEKSSAKFSAKSSAKSKTNKKPFQQGIKFTSRHVKLLNQGKITITDLVHEGVIEFIAPSEQSNMLLAISLKRLRKYCNDETHEYTHCDVPQSQFGITILIGPHVQMNQTTRSTFLGNQAKQTCGYPTLNWPYRCGKDAFLQYKSESPIVRTFMNKYLIPNGMNAMVAIACYSGYNQEDSLVISKRATDSGFCTGSKFTNYQAELEQNEQFGVPDEAKTRNPRSANFSKVGADGFTPRNTKLDYGDVVIAKYVTLARSNQDFAYEDRSIVYKSAESGIVHEVIHSKNDEHNDFGKVTYRKHREIEEGDKFSSRHGQKGIAAIKFIASDLPRTVEGMAPDIIVNPHAIPSRMTIGQLYESLVGTLGVIKGTHIDGTVFREINIEEIAEEIRELLGSRLKHKGYTEYGYHKMYSGITGDFIDAFIFMGPTYYQRLQKFVVDTIYSVSKSPTVATTRQPLNGGKSSNGGVKIGEMELWCLAGSGLARFISEKYRDHSDGYDLYPCRSCGEPAIVNKEYQIFKCKNCANPVIENVKSTYSSKLFMQELRAMGITVKLLLTPYTFTHRIEQADQLGKKAHPLPATAV